MPKKQTEPSLEFSSADQPAKPGSAIQYAELLNAAQLKAACFGRGPLLVIAGAGTGKTRTLTYRVARLVEDGVPPESILLLSFTRKASKEMLRRAELLLDWRCRNVAGGTFHSFANIVLRRYAREIGFANGFSIIDRADSEDLIGMIRRELSTVKDDRQLPRKSTLANIFSRAINKAVPTEDIVYEDYPQFDNELETILEIERMYRVRKLEHGFCDFDDLLIYLRLLLSEHEDIRSQLSSTYEFILVDEYQDTNLIQADIIYLLAGSRKNIMVVGDDAQSIYAFRGANFKNIISFPDRFPGAQIIKLEENYRSRQPILDLTNAIIDEAGEKYSKLLFTRKKGGRRPVLTACPNENAQSGFVVNEIIKLVSEGTDLHEIAVLFRAGFHSFDLELELNRHAIPFVKYGGFKFAESAHIKDLLAHLRILVKSTDRLSWHRVLLLIDKIGPKTAQSIYDCLSDRSQGPNGTVRLPIKKAYSAAIAPLQDMIAAVTETNLSVVQKGEHVLSYYLPILKKRYDDHPRRQRDLQQLLSIMERYDDLDIFLADMVLEPPGNSVDGHLADSPTNRHRLTLSTVHSAKGLEWHTVFVIWALDGRFPSYRTLEHPEAIEEERRLMYVACTRARENLHITYPGQVYDRISQSYLYRPSRFLDHIGDDLLERFIFNPMV